MCGGQVGVGFFKHLKYSLADYSFSSEQPYPASRRITKPTCSKMNNSLNMYAGLVTRRTKRLHVLQTQNYKSSLEHDNYKVNSKCI